MSSTIQIRVEDELKTKSDTLFNQMVGLYASNCCV